MVLAKERNLKPATVWKQQHCMEADDHRAHGGKIHKATRLLNPNKTYPMQLSMPDYHTSARSAMVIGFHTVLLFPHDWKRLTTNWLVKMRHSKNFFHNLPKIM